MEDKSKEQVKKDVEASGIQNYIEQMKAQYPNTNPVHLGICPNCGYCPCCGRPRGDWNYPINPYPYWPAIPIYQGTIC